VVLVLVDQVAVVAVVKAVAVVVVELLMKVLLAVVQVDHSTVQAAAVVLVL
jgi:hypothetical protein